MPLLVAAPVVAAALVVIPAGSSSSAAKPVVLVPFAGVQQSVVAEVAQTMRKSLGVRVTVGTQLPIAASARNAARKQVVADMLLGTLQTRVRQAGDGSAAVIGITSDDLLPANPSWRWEFAQRTGNVGILSVARMDPVTWGLEPDRALLLRRLRKFAIRYGAIMALGKPETSSPRSALFDSILSIDDLDLMEATLAPGPYPSVRRSWLTGAETACRRAGTTWRSVVSGLQTADVDRTRELLVQWAEADEQLLTALRARPSGGSSAIDAALVKGFRARAAFLRAIAAPTHAFSSADGARLQVLTAGLRPPLLELGSRACANAVA